VVQPLVVSARKQIHINLPSGG